MHARHDAPRLETVTGFSARPLRPSKPKQRLVDLVKSSRPQGTVDVSVAMHDGSRLETFTGFSARPLRPSAPKQRLVDLEKSSRPQGTVDVSVEPKESRRRAEPQGKR